MQARLQGKKFKMQSMAQNCFKTKSIRKLSNFNFQWTKTLYQNNFKHSAFFFTLFRSFKCYKLYTIQFKFYCQLPMGAFQRQILIVQVIKKIIINSLIKKYSRIVNKQLLRNYLHIEFMTSQIDYQ